MRFSILYLLLLVTCVAVALKAFFVYREVGELRVMLGRVQSELVRVRPWSAKPGELPPLGDLSKEQAEYEATLRSHGVSADSARFLPSINDHRTDPSLYFADPAVAQLCRNISMRDQAAITKALEAGVNVNVQGEGGVTPLIWAISNDNTFAFMALLNKGADPDLALNDFVPGSGYLVPGANAMSLCLDDRRYLFAKPNLAFLLPFALHSTKDINRRYQYQGGNTLLMQFLSLRSIGQSVPASSHLQVFTALLNAGADLDVQNDIGQTACHLASNRPSYCMKLIDAGANPLLPDDVGRDLLDLVEEFFDNRSTAIGAPSALAKPGNRYKFLDKTAKMYMDLRTRLIKIRDSRAELQDSRSGQ